MEEVDYVAKSDKGSVFVFIRYWSQAQLHDGWFEEDDLSNLQEVLHEVCYYIYTHTNIHTFMKKDNRTRTNHFRH